MEKRLVEALRQYKHNHGRGGFVFAYDKYTIDCIFADLRKIVEEMKGQRRRLPNNSNLTKFINKIEDLLKRGE